MNPLFPPTQIPAVIQMLAMLLAGAVAAKGTENGTLVFRSGPAQVALIELYTSEGCSSCPPAEKWLGDLRDEKGVWRDFVPVAFHVNYWDRLGWRDVLASKAFTDRQYAHAARWDASSVYTPCFVRNGQEWRRPASMPASRSREGVADVGTLTIQRPSAGKSWQVTYAPSASASRRDDASEPRELEATLVLLGSGIVNQVRKGENSGRELRHEFVALRLEKAALIRDPNGTWSTSFALEPRPDISAPRYGIAAWVSQPGNLTPLQAVGGWLTPVAK
jgi:hypothetical protein